VLGIEYSKEENCNYNVEINVKLLVNQVLIYKDF